jgi:hypothetical protein
MKSVQTLVAIAGFIATPADANWQSHATQEPKAGDLANTW